MAQFYFHLRTPDEVKFDGLGLDLPTLDDAYLEACRAIPGMASDLIRERADPMDYAFEIGDGAGQTLMLVPFSELLSRKSAKPGQTGDASAPPRPAVAAMKAARAVFHMAFVTAPLPFLVLTPDLIVAGANHAYCKVTGQRPEELAGRHIFEAFPDNPDEPEASGLANLGRSFDRALKTGMQDTLPLQRYDICDRHGQWRPRYWHSSNWTVTDDDGTVLAVIHHVREASPQEEATNRRPRLSIARIAGGKRWSAM